MFRRILDAEMKVSCKSRVATINKKAEREAVTEEEERIMWEKNLLGCQTAKSLVRTIYFYNGKLFGIRSKEHRELRVHNFRIDSNSVTYDESFSKTYHGGLKDLKYNPRVIQHICCLGKEVNHFPCIVNCYSTYIGKVKHLAKTNEAFYFKPNTNEAIVEYYNMVLGINTLNKILPDLCESAGFSRKTSHCLRVTCASRLFQSEVQEKLIRERTGHRSNALLAYEKKSTDQNDKVCKILGPPEVIVDEVVEEEEYIPQISSLTKSDSELLFDFDVPDEVDEILSAMPLPGDNENAGTSTSSATGSSATLSGCVFNNCAVYFGKM